jgi:exopolyphosphatase/guanosine-5'-triphosphate,3'-diphosphate pyrophosphatase
MTGPALAAPRLGAIDIGTNSIRLIVAEVQPDGTYRVLDEEREMTRLGAGLARTGLMAPESIERTLDSLGKMKAIADGFGVSELRAAGTSAVREAENGGAFRREAWRRHRIRVEVVSPEEEARLAFESAMRRFDLEGRAVAVADIGGGSLEVVLSAGSIVDQVHSLPLGAVRLTEKHVRSDPLKDKHWRALRRTIDASFRKEIGKPPFTVEVLVGSGGTFSALGGMVRFEREGKEGNPHGYTVTRAEVTRMLARFLEVPESQRRQIPGMPPQRADIMVAGTAVVARLAKHLRCRQIIVNDGGVRDGLILAMIADLGLGAAVSAAPPTRLDAVRRFARRCLSNERHGGQVAQLAGGIFDGLRNRFGLDPENRELLVAAALVHDVGFLVNHAQHHKHAYHLIMHSDLAGWSAREVEAIANVVRYHRRAYPKRAHANFARLDKADRRLVRRLAGILRIAVALNRSHQQLVTDVRCHARRGRVTIVAVAGEEPLVELWDARRKAGLFEKAFDARLTVKWDAATATAERPLRVVRGKRGAQRTAARVIPGSSRASG